MISSCKRIATTLPLIFCLLIANPVFARLINPYNFKRIAKEADLLVTGEVVKTAAVKQIPAKQTRWNLTLTRMQAEIKVWRVGSAVPATAPAPVTGKTITLAYDVPASSTQMMLEAPDFPHLVSGDVYVFPLRKAAKEKQAAWQLISEEDLGMLVPAIITPFVGQYAGSKQDFLVAELANAFAKGSYPQIHRAGLYGARYLNDPATADAIRRQVEAMIHNDLARWLQIIVATYSATGMPRPTIAELAQGKNPGYFTFLTLVQAALAHLDPWHRDEQLIAVALEHATTNPGGTKGMLAQNYPRHPTTIKLLTEMLNKDSCGALGIAASLIREKNHPLLSIAMLAALRQLKRPEQAHGDYAAACTLIRDFGDAKAFSILLAEIAGAKKSDFARYRLLWSYCAYSGSSRTVAICRLYLDDQREYTEYERFCDVAVDELQRVTRADFGVKTRANRAERDAAITKAEKWLKKNGNG